MDSTKPSEYRAEPVKGDQNPFDVDAFTTTGSEVPKDSQQSEPVAEQGTPSGMADTRVPEDVHKLREAEASGQSREATTSGVPLLPNMDPVALAEALGVHSTEEGGK